MHLHSDFVPLHLHTEYSLLDGAIRIKELVEQASAFRMPAVAITDHGNLFGAVEFYRLMTKAGIKPIIGCEVYVAPGSRLEKKQSPDGEGASFHLILLARDNNGYRNLITLVTKAYTEGFYYRPRIDMDLLEQYSGGLIALTSCLKGEIPHYLQRGMMERARDKALEYKHLLGPDNFYIELQENGLPEQVALNKQLVELARDLHIGIVATNDCHYMRREDAKAHDILVCIQTGKSVNDKNRLHFTSDGLYFKSPEEMKTAFRDLPEAILNTRAIAERCNVEFTLGVNLLPKYDLENGKTPDVMLGALAYEGLAKRLGAEAPGTYGERLKREIGIIKEMDYASYFLIVWDFISYAKSKGIPVGPGRGSAAGSLVSYCLGITDIDPVKYNLLFERFLNPERISMPDIDVDFCKDRRAEVIAYVAEKYGTDHVAQIIT
ncbi:MAG: DNA polymerase III subunit alpha, partial [Nitrospirales bacterium]